jgi:hypothetical protein
MGQAKKGPDGHPDALLKDGDQQDSASLPVHCVNREQADFMPADELPEGDLARVKLVTAALRLVSVSVAFGVASGTVAVTTGLQNHSLGVFAAGLGVLADITGSAVLIWRFGAKLRRPLESGNLEARAAVVVAVALRVVSAVLLIESVDALTDRISSRHVERDLLAEGVSLVVLAPLAYAKRRLGRRLASRALRGDGALSGVGTATSLLALTAPGALPGAGLVVGRPDRRLDRRSHRGRGSLAYRATAAVVSAGPDPGSASLGGRSRTGSGVWRGSAAPR